jgi:pSer/pThr/pTyr-binding forkhead associated (FHA) protein
VDQALLADEVAATSMELPGIAAPYESPQPRPGDDDAPDAPEGRTLVLMSDGREPDRVVKERYLIGRGKHCDLVINSGKVSREHAAIIREGAAWYIEDLGSSNGTWFEKRRISRRQIQEGDEYYICSEKLSCSFR